MSQNKYDGVIVPTTKQGASDAANKHISNYRTQELEKNRTTKP
jgi:hypothetical protein